jgi:hypothetical protein
MRRARPLIFASPAATSSTSGRMPSSSAMSSSASNHVFHPLISGEVNYDVREVFHGMAMWVDVPNVIAAHPSTQCRVVRTVLTQQ